MIENGSPDTSLNNVFRYTYRNFNEFSHMGRDDFFVSITGSSNCLYFQIFLPL